MARLRLANVLLDEAAPEDALKALSLKPAPGFEALFEALRGDIYLIQKKPAEARGAYRAAIEKAGKGDAALSEQLRRKIDALGEG